MLTRSFTLAFFGITSIPGLQTVVFERVGVQFACVVAGRADQLVAVAAHSYAHAISSSSENSGDMTGRLRRWLP